MLAHLNERETFWLIAGTLVAVYAIIAGLISAFGERSERHYRDMDSVRASMNYQAYLNARKAGIGGDHMPLIPPCSNSSAATPVGTDVSTGETRYTDDDGLVRVEPITDVRTHRPRPIRDNPQG